MQPTNDRAAFNADLQVGDVAQQALVDFLVRLGCTVETAPVGTKEYDLRVRHPTGPTVLVEVKGQRSTPDTGNVAVEVQYLYANRGWGPSGINATKAGIWANVIPLVDDWSEVELLLLKSSVMRDAALEAKARNPSAEKTNHNGSAKNILVRREKLVARKGCYQFIFKR